MKVQELLAKIGGLINALLIISKIFFYHYLRFLYNLYLNKMVYNILSDKSKPQLNIPIKQNSNLNQSESYLNKKDESKSDNLILKSNNIQSINPKSTSNLKNQTNIKKTLEVKDAPQLEIKQINKPIIENQSYKHDEDQLNFVSSYLKMNYFENLKVILCCNKNYSKKKSSLERISSNVIQLQTYMKLLDVKSIVSQSEK